MRQQLQPPISYSIAAKIQLLQYLMLHQALAQILTGLCGQSTALQPKYFQPASHTVQALCKFLDSTGAEAVVPQIQLPQE